MTNCKGKHFKLHKLVCRQPLRDTKYSRVIAHRYRCLKCHGSFRLYPQGVAVATAILTGEPLAFEILKTETAFRIEQ
jgi:hypothetical protein